MVRMETDLVMILVIHDRDVESWIDKLRWMASRSVG